MKINFLTIFILLISTAVYAKKPAWINDPASECRNYEICAVGEASGTMRADANARQEMAKIFKTRIKGSTAISTRSQQVSDNEGIISGRIDEDTFNKVKETTDQVLEGIVIKKRFEGKDAFYALAVLNKNSAAKGFVSKMKSLDEKIEELYKDGRRSSLNKILKLFKIRKALNEKYQLVKGRLYPRRVSYSKVMERKRALRKKNITIYVDIKEIEKNKEIQHMVIKQLLGNDYRVVTNKKMKYHYIVKGTIKTQREYLKVKGFQKHKFLVSLKSINKKNENIGSLKFEVSKIGRSLKQTYEDAIPEIMDNIREQLDELNID